MNKNPYQMEPAINVLGGSLEPCSEQPLTGFFRDGCCNTHSEDVGSHTVCVQATESFLEYSRFRGNDLSTPIPEYQFPGLQAGDNWCLCAARWLEAYNLKMAPKVWLKRTHIKALDVIPLEHLKAYALDL